jgi:hypothetical protein
MRIRNDGSGFFGSGGGGSRSDSFRKGRKPGQKVHGKLVKWISDDRAWVLIDGHHLLAQLQSRPQVGAHLTFIIQQLHPDIVLKEVFEASGAGPGALTMAGDFETARTLFENALRTNAATIANAPAEARMDSFFSLLTSDSTLRATYLDAVNCLKTINSQFGGDSSGEIMYQPWLAPNARRQLTRVRHKLSSHQSTGLVEVSVECETKPLGLVRTELLFKAPSAGYRLKIQRPSLAAALKETLLALPFCLPGIDVECLGVAKLPQGEHGGILAEFMFAR